MSVITIFPADGPRRRLTIVKRRRAFGLDAPRAPDPGRTEAAILDWLATQMPDIVPLRVLPSQGGADEARSAAGDSRLVALLLPDGRFALLRIETPSGDRGPDALALAALCRRRRVPLSVASNLDEARQALRCLGLEPRAR